jgi:hypothetical protein
MDVAQAGSGSRGIGCGTGVRDRITIGSGVEARRSKAQCVGLAVLTVALGLASRRYPAAFPAVVARYGGDALWAAMVFWLVALLRSGMTSARVALAAFAIALAVEGSQLYHAPWIDAVRGTRLGALALGQGFLWSDLVSYAVGVVLAAVLDVWLTRRNTLRETAAGLR